MKKRFILTLLHDGYSFFISRNFKLQVVGNIDWIIQNFQLTTNSCGIDEIVIIFTSNDENNYEKFLSNVKKIKSLIFLPLVVGGKIKTLERVNQSLAAGADKVLIGYPSNQDFGLISEVRKTFGRQFIVCSIDYTKKNENEFYLYERGMDGNHLIKDLINDLYKGIVGEVMFTSVDRDGSGMGFDLDFIHFLKSFQNNIPVLISGGAGKITDYYEVLQYNHIDGASSSNLFHFMGSGFVKAKECAQGNGLDVNFWNTESIQALKNVYER